MIKVSVDKKSINDLVKNLRSKIRTFKDMSNEIAELLAKAFVARARKRLLAFTGQKRYSYYINAVQNGNNSWSVIIRSPKYDPYIMYFLEYGTGFTGKKSEQNPSKPAGWEFTINLNNPKAFWYDEITIGGSMKEGWFFNYKPNHFIQEEDIILSKPNKDVVFTSGIKPVMYLYKTRKEINSLLRQTFRNGEMTVTYKELRKRLNAIIGGAIT